MAFVGAGLKPAPTGKLQETQAGSIAITRVIPRLSRGISTENSRPFALLRVTHSVPLRQGLNQFVSRPPPAWLFRTGSKLVPAAHCGSLYLREFARRRKSAN